MYMKYDRHYTYKTMTPQSRDPKWCYPLCDNATLRKRERAHETRFIWLKSSCVGCKEGITTFGKHDCTFGGSNDVLLHVSSDSVAPWGQKEWRDGRMRTGCGDYQEYGRSQCWGWENEKQALKYQGWEMSYSANLLLWAKDKKCQSFIVWLHSVCVCVSPTESIYSSRNN